MPADEKALRDRYAALPQLIDDARKAISDFNASGEGKKRDKLEKKYKKSTDKMTAGEFATLAEL